jgi:protein RecA
MSKADDFAAALEKAIGNNEETQEVREFLDSGYAPLNMILSGAYDKGLPYGRIVEMFGPPSSGKTALATQFMISAQQKGGVAMFMDHENSFDVGLAKGMGLKDEFPYWIYRRPETWEESNTMAMKAAQLIRTNDYIGEHAPIIVVFDSVASMIPKSVFEKGIDEYSMNDTTALSRVSSTTLKAINQLSSKLNVTMLYLNQIRTKPGVAYGDPTTTPGGSAFEFYSSVRISLSRARIMEEKDGDKEMVGQRITLKTTKNKINRPFQDVALNLRFGDKGGAYFDFTGGLLDHLIEKGVVTAAGARVNWTDGKSYFRKALIEKINEEKIDLKAMLPK